MQTCAIARISALSLQWSPPLAAAEGGVLDRTGLTQDGKLQWSPPLAAAEGSMHERATRVRFPLQWSPPLAAAEGTVTPAALDLGATSIGE